MSTDSILASLLGASRLVPEPGIVEVFPRPSIWEDGHRKPGQPLRLPFGEGTVMLDPEELIPVARNGAAEIRRVRQAFQRGYVEPLDVAELTHLAARRGRPGRPRRRRKRGAAAVSRMTADELARLDREGLSHPGQLNDALLFKAVDYFARDVPRDEAEELLVRWLDARHNGQSRTYNRDPASARREARSTLGYVYSTFVPHGPRASPVELTEFECSMIEAATNGPGERILDAVSGIEVPRVKVQRLMFTVQQGMKGWVLSRCQRGVESLVRRFPKLAVGTEQFDDRFLDEVRPFWPHPPNPLFVVQSPYAFRRLTPGLSEETMAAAWRIAKETRLFMPVRRASADAHRAESFLVVLDFGLFPAWGDATTSWSKAVVGMLSPEQLRERYSPYYVEKIIREGRADPSHYDPDHFARSPEAYVQRRLRAACVHCGTRTREPLPEVRYDRPEREEGGA